VHDKEPYFEKCLCDLAASINSMPYSAFKKISMRELEPTNITLHLADCSMVHPRGVIEDVLVKIDKFIFLANFVVLDIETNENIPIILGRPFLHTCDLVVRLH